MDDSADNPDLVVEGPESDSPAFPQVGRDLVPSPAQIAAGRIGNGAWDLTDASVERAQYEIHQAKRAERDERRQFFHESAKDALADAIKLHHSIIRRGNDVMARLEDPDEDRPVTAKDMQVLAMAQKAAKELTDRAIGRAGQAATEESSSTHILTLIQRNNDQ